MSRKIKYRWHQGGMEKIEEIDYTDKPEKHPIPTQGRFSKIHEKYLNKKKKQNGRHF